MASPNQQALSMASHVVQRAGFGQRGDEPRRVAEMGHREWIEEQLAPELIDDSETKKKVDALPVLDSPLTDLMDRRDMKWEERIQSVEQCRHATILRQTESKRQIFEAMVRLWHLHFSVYSFNNAETIVLFSDWDQQIRQRALGNFRDLLEATAKHPVMLYYLDNVYSTNSGPNENYARELLELHTLSADAYQRQDGYVDDDVYEVSRCFTGWSVENGKQHPRRGTFKYTHKKHDRFQKRVLGNTIERDQAPLRDGQQVLDLLCDHPATSRAIAKKLCVQFVSDQPPQSIIDSTAKVFYQSRKAPDQIKRTLQHLLTSHEFETSAGQKFKSPHDWIVSMLRAMRYDINYDRPRCELTWFMERMGEPMFGWRTPDGPPLVAEEWANSNNMVWRWRMASEYADNWHKKRGISFEPIQLIGDGEYTPKTLAQTLADKIIGPRVSEKTMRALENFASKDTKLGDSLSAEQLPKITRQAAAICVMSPEFMRR